MNWDIRHIQTCVLNFLLLQPLSGLQANGPGLHYKVMWRQKYLDSEWTSVTVANNSRFIVSGTPTFVPFELKVQAVNDYGAGPEPAVALGFSGEDRECERIEIGGGGGKQITSSPAALSAWTVPVAIPDNVQAIVLNSTVAEIHWDPVPSKLLRGHLKGFKVQKTSVILF